MANGTNLVLLRPALCALLSELAEVHGNRTHHGHRLPVTGFEVQEAHQNLSTSNFTLIDFLIKVNPFGSKPLFFMDSFHEVDRCLQQACLLPLIS